jgi:hypothetical protein
MARSPPPSPQPPAHDVHAYNLELLSFSGGGWGRGVYKIDYFWEFTAMLQRLFLLMAEFTFATVISLIFC